MNKTRKEMEDRLYKHAHSWYIRSILLYMWYMQMYIKVASPLTKELAYKAYFGRLVTVANLYNDEKKV